MLINDKCPQTRKVQNALLSHKNDICTFMRDLGKFMPPLSVFFLIDVARHLYINMQKIYGKKNLHVPNVKLFSILSNVFGFSMLFLFLFTR